jgi:hypothetical protein
MDGVGSPANARQSADTMGQMAAILKDVYCYQRGSEDCYKIGRTKETPEKRKRGFATGSPVKFTLCRTEKTAHPTKLEKHVHALLGTRRAENGEFFFVTRPEVDKAFDQAVAFVEEAQDLIENAGRLKKRKPADTMLDVTPEVLSIYKELQARQRESFLVEREIEVLESRMQLAIGENSGIEGIATWKWRDSWTFDLKKFQREEPADYETLFEKYKRNSGTRYFDLAKGILTKADH